ncbi:MAG TPA: hypothetical protein DCE31_05065 [Lautropia sp.]|nr:hypothetical protein [Lautropia sp.]
MFTLITLLIPLLSFWLSMGLVLIDGFALPLARMKAEHLAADCVHQASMLSDGAIAEGSDQARACEKHLDAAKSPHVGKAFLSTASEPLRAYSVTRPAATVCALEIALCAQPQVRGEAMALSDIRVVRYEKNRCFLADQRAVVTASQQAFDRDAGAGPAYPGEVSKPNMGLAPIINCQQQGPVEIGLSDWQCVDYHHDVLRWWGSASRLSSPCLHAASQLSQGLESAAPMLGRELKLRYAATPARR